MKRLGKKLLTPAWLPLLATVCLSGCDRQVFYLPPPLIQGSAEVSLTSTQKKAIGAAVIEAVTHSRHLKICRDTDCPAGATAKLVLNRLSQRGFSCQLTVTAGGDTFTATNLNTPTQTGAAEECIRQLDDNLQWHFMSTRELLAAFDQPGMENSTFDLLLDELIRRRSSEAIPVLGHLLQKTTSMEIFSKTLGALVATGDPAAARVIIQSNRHRTPEIARQLVFALEELPCQESDNYLETLATGHPDRQVRAAAAIVLEGRKKLRP